MSNLVITILVVLVYIIQVLLMLSYPYYEYRQNYKRHKDRTIGGFVKFTSSLMGDGFMIIVLFPIIGLIAFILMCILGLIITVYKTFYDKYIKDIKI